jgi:hypothetical protein
MAMVVMDIVRPGFWKRNFINAYVTINSCGLDVKFPAGCNSRAGRIARNTP